MLEQRIQGGRLMKFRGLRADEIDIRVGTVTAKGVSLLLYKDARCDMNILDESIYTFRMAKTTSCNKR